jgi:hypothetical protein
MLCWLLTHTFISLTGHLRKHCFLTRQFIDQIERVSVARVAADSSACARVLHERQCMLACHISAIGPCNKVPATDRWRR